MSLLKINNGVAVVCGQSGQEPEACAVYCRRRWLAVSSSSSSSPAAAAAAAVIRVRWRDADITSSTFCCLLRNVPRHLLNCRHVHVAHAAHQVRQQVSRPFDNSVNFNLSQQAIICES